MSIERMKEIEQEIVVLYDQDRELPASLIAEYVDLAEAGCPAMGGRLQQVRTATGRLWGRYKEEDVPEEPLSDKTERFDRAIEEMNCVSVQVMRFPWTEATP